MGKHEDHGKPYPNETVLIALYGPECGWFAEAFRVKNYTDSEFPVKKLPVKHRLTENFGHQTQVRYFTSTGELRRVGDGYTATQHVDHVQRELEIGALWKEPR